MRNKIFFSVFCVVVMLSMVLTACAPAAPAPAAEAPAAEAPAAEAPKEEAPAEAPAAEAPAEEAPAAEAPAEEAPAAEEKPITVALVVGVKDDGFYVTMEKGAREKAKELGVELVADGPAQFEPALQTPIVDAMIAKGVDAMLIAATNSQAMIEPIKRAYDAGIKVVSVDTFIGDSAGDYTTGSVTFPLSYVGSDNVLGGKIACEAIIESMGGKGSIYIQNVKPGISTTDQREQGCKEAIEASGGAVTLAGVDYNDDDSGKAAQQTAAVLQRVPDLGGVFGTNLFSARGAAQAVKNANLAGTVKIAAFDAPEAAIQDLRDEVVDLVIAQKPAEIGSTALEYAVSAIRGDESKIEKRKATGYVVITRENVDTPEAQGAIYKSTLDEEPAAEAPAAEAPADGKKLTFALVQGVKDDGFYITMEKGARAKAEELGVELVVDGPAQFEPALQTPIVDAMIAKGVDAIMIAATNSQAMIEPIKRAYDAGIQIVSVDTYIGDSAGDYTTGSVTFPLSYVGSDNVLGGKIACEAIIEAMGGKGSIYIQNVKPGISTTDQREQGCKEAIEASGGAVTLAGVDYNDDDSGKAAQQTAAVLQRVPDLGGVFGTNLFSARGAAQAVKNANLAGTVKIAAFDAPEAAIQDLRDEVVDLVIAQKPAEIGEVAVDYAFKAINGQESEIQKRFATGYVVITRENVDTPEAQGAIYKSK